MNKREHELKERGRKWEEKEETIAEELANKWRRKFLNEALTQKVGKLTINVTL